MIKKLLILTLFTTTLLFSTDLTGTPAPLFYSKNQNSPQKEFIKINDEIAKGNGVVVAFFATWCNPCREELPFLQSVQNQMGFSLLVVSVDDSWGVAESGLIDELGITAPVLHDKYKMISKQYGYSGKLPYAVYINSEGDITAISTGFSTSEKPYIINNISSLKK